MHDCSRGQAAESEQHRGGELKLHFDRKLDDTFRPSECTSKENECKVGGTSAL